MRFWVPADGTDIQQTDGTLKKQNYIDICTKQRRLTNAQNNATHRLNRPRGRFSKKSLCIFFFDPAYGQHSALLYVCDSGVQILYNECCKFH